MKSDNNPKVLHLTLKRKWFLMILQGEKKEEYREFTDYWISRLLGFPYPFPEILPEDFKKFDIVRFRNGYQKDAPTFDIKCEGIELSTGNPEWGAIPGKECFVIKLGDFVGLDIYLEACRRMVGKQKYTWWQREINRIKLWESTNK